MRSTLRPDVVVVGIVLAIFFVIEVRGARSKSAAMDEPAHLAGGLAYWRDRDLRLNPENGLLPQAWATLPIFLAGDRFPRTDRPEWHSAKAALLGYELLYGEGNDADRILSRSRAMITLFGIGLALVVYAWSTQLFGRAAGLLSLVLCCFHPSILAHARLVTSDIAAAFFLIAAVWSLWRLLHEPRPAAFVTAAVVSTGLVLSKMSAVVLIPIALAMSAVRARWGPPLPARAAKHPLAVFALTAFLLGGVVVAGIWAAFGFRYQASFDPQLATDHYAWSWAELTGNSGAAGSVVEFVRSRHWMPEAFLYGFAVILSLSHDHPQFFNGEISGQGWWGFFPYCFLAKTPLSEMLILLIAGVVAIRGWGRPQSPTVPSLAYRTSPLWILLAVYWAFALTSQLNVGERHLLPSYPALFILAGVAARGLEKERFGGTRRGLLVAAAVALYCLESLSFYPHYLAYFNPIVGGPRTAYRHVVDSSLDWGQDLPGLARWLERRRSDPDDRTPVYLSYFGLGDPQYYGIRATRLPGYPEFRTSRDVEPLTGGIYCISATMVESLFLRFPGTWTEAYDSLYRSVRADTDRYLAAGGEERARLRRESGELFWNERFGLLDDLRLAKLYAALRKREPDTSVGYSILIYELTDEEVAKALGPVGS